MTFLVNHLCGQTKVGTRCTLGSDHLHLYRSAVQCKAPLLQDLNCKNRGGSCAGDLGCLFRAPLLSYPVFSCLSCLLPPPPSSSPLSGMRGYPVPGIIKDGAKSISLQFRQCDQMNTSADNYALKFFAPNKLPRDATLSPDLPRHPRCPFRCGRMWKRTSKGAHVSIVCSLIEDDDVSSTARTYVQLARPQPAG